MDNVCNSDCPGGESRIFDPQSNAQVAFFFICSFTGTVECANVHVDPK